MNIKSLFSFLRRKELSGDFSSFDHACPIEGCNWYFQSNEERQKHIEAGKHGDDMEVNHTLSNEKK